MRQLTPPVHHPQQVEIDPISNSPHPPPFPFSHAPQLPYKVIEVNPLLKSELKWSSYKKVSICVGIVQEGGNLCGDLELVYRHADIYV